MDKIEENILLCQSWFIGKKEYYPLAEVGGEQGMQ